MRTRKLRNKITAIAAAAMLVVSSMTVTAFADTTTEKGVTSGITENKISIAKEIQLLDVDDDAYIPSVPNIKYKYTVTPITGTDATGIVISVKEAENDIRQQHLSDGAPTLDAGANIELSFAPNDTTVTTESKGGKHFAKKTFDVDFSAVTFPHAGIYRYKIVESVMENNTNVTNQNDATRYLDVYVKNEGGNLKVTDSVMTKESTAGNNVIKTDGFVSDYYEYTKTDGAIDKAESVTSIPDSTVSVYKTYDLKISKAVSGDLADKSYKFKFKVAFSSGNSSDKNISFKYKYNDDSTLNNTQMMSAETTPTLTVDSLELNNGRNVTIKGIPATVKYTVSEKKHEVDTYAVSVKINNTSLGDSDLEDEESGGNSYKKIKVAREIKSDDNVADTVDFTNTLASVSPTGLVFKIMPYIIMIALALVLGYVYLGRRNKANE